MLKYIELRKKIENFPKYPGTKRFNKAPVVNKAFPSHFNLSYSEPEQIELFGSLINIPKPLFYSKIQPVIRTNDFLTHILAGTKDAYKYLALFDLGDIGGTLMSPNQDDLKSFHEHAISSLWKFLTEELNFNPNKIYVSCFAGGKVDEVTEGKYKINKYIRPDKLSIEMWKKLGLKKSNIILDHSRNTLLALCILKRATPWGYRNEVLLDISENSKHKELLDIGTVEYFIWEPVLKGEEIVDIKKWNACIVLHGIGLERTLIGKNKFKHILECDHIYPLYKLILDDSKDKDVHYAHILTEALRALHRILTDCKGWKNLSSRHKYLLKKYMLAIYNSMKQLKIEISQKKIEEYLKLNAKLQSFYPELNKNIPKIVEDLVSYFKRKKLFY